MIRLSLIVVGLALLAPSTALAQWAQFRGANAGDVADDPALPDTWSETENVVWDIDIPGLSWSSPVVWEDTIFITSAISAGDEPDPIPGLYDPGDDNGATRSSQVHRWVVYNIDFGTGEIRWERELDSATPEIARHIKNSFASETPVTDGRRVYAYFGSAGVVGALNMSGETVWRTELGAYETTLGFGSAASPTLHGDRLYLVNDNVEQSFMVAIDKNSGEEIWRVERPERGQNWATPFVWENEVRTEIVTSGTQGVRSYDMDGNLLWEIHGMSGLTIPTPFAKHGLLYISSGYPGGGLRPVYVVKPGASGDISLWSRDDMRTGLSSGFPGTRASSDDVAWAYPLLGTYNTSALVYGDYYYTLLDRGFLVAHDARTGEEIYSRKRLEIGNGFTASPWAYNGKIFLLSEDGETFVVKAGPDFEILHKNPLNEMTLATPAIVRGSLIVRTQSKLYRIAEGGQP
ncbi:MAG: PQQ-binding-like beta-propeller repeat protein [Vicinamibacterales bacterium]|jgi:outer membrane protein assembly factor BamB|nr:PQQ-binding-like beta-propeller repeat protein [Vicinamibacterales bacterium]HJN46499.1 PQQ-binding-like beta-propeller repeat protein [Vicinamibacterales bacterium]|tara:strand:+ start:2302 stop:3684 length:1383 start_codon:yes stop_codon:yes gene_type:complete